MIKLQKGDEIRIVAPSTGLKIIGQDCRILALQRFEKMGLKVSFGKNTSDENWNEFGSSDVAKRVDDIMDAFKDQNVKAIFSIIGGFNSNQILPYLDYEVIRNNPKIICGFSDITALLNGIYAKTGMITFSGPHYSSFGMELGFEYTNEAFRKIFFEDGKNEIKPSSEWSDDLWFINQKQREFIKNEGYWNLHDGEAEGIIVGGNLNSFNLLLGSEYQPSFNEDTVLFIENCFSNSNDDKDFLRNLQALAYQPNFDKVKAVVIGRFQKASNISRLKLEAIIKSIPVLQSLPIIANVDFGHTTPMLTLPIGGKATIKNGMITIEL